MRTRLLLPALFIVPLTAAHGAAPEHQTFPAAGLASLSVAAGAGDISVAGSTGDIRVEITDNDPEKCFLTIKTEAGQFILKAEDSAAVIARSKQGFWKSLFSLSGGSHGYSGCIAGFNVSAPPALALKTRTGSGEINIRGRAGEVGADTGSGHITVDKISGDLSARTGSGGISGSACAENVTARTGSGDVDLTGLCAAADAKTGSGGITLRWSKVPVSGAVRAETGSGNIILIFPPSAGVAATLDSGSGRISNDFGDTGKFPVSAGTGSGDISVRKAGTVSYTHLTLPTILRV